MTKDVIISGRSIGKALYILPAPDEAYSTKSIAKSEKPIIVKKIKFSQ